MNRNHTITEEPVTVSEHAWHSTVDGQYCMCCGVDKRSPDASKPCPGDLEPGRSEEPWF